MGHAKRLARKVVIYSHLSLEEHLFGFSGGGLADHFTSFLISVSTGQRVLDAVITVKAVNMKTAVNHFLTMNKGLVAMGACQKSELSDVTAYASLFTPTIHDESLG